MSDPLAAYTFLPWLRRGASSEITRVDGEGPAASRAAFPIEVSFNADLNASVSLSLYGPGDVTGLDGRVVIRTWPRADVSSAESNYFPLIEFDQADLPWRYTPARATDRDRLRPWLCLIALKETEIESYEPAGPDRPLSVVNVKSAEALPRLDQSWAWAHVQVSGVQTIDASAMADILANEPERVLARLLCPRRLESRTAYRAFLVPTFEIGRLAGLGQPIAEGLDGLTPAWSDQAAMIDLPVYYEWRFRTGVAGDFESLVRQLKARTLPPTVGIRAMDVSHPDDVGLPGLSAASEPLGLEGALKTKATRSTPWDRDERRRWLDGFIDEQGQSIGGFKQLLNRPAELLEGAEHERAIAPPLYGQWYALRDKLAPGDLPPWFHELNADPRLRVTAGLGTLVVQSQQQQLMASAWRQVEGIRSLNDELRQAQVAREVATRIHERHIRPLDAETLLQVTEPVHPRVPASPVTVHCVLAASRIAEGALEPQWRRVARPRGPLGRRQGRTDRPRSSTFLERMNRGELSAAPPPPRPSGMATPLRTGVSLMPEWATLGTLNFLRALSRWLTIVALISFVVAVLLLVTGQGVGLTIVLAAVGLAALGGAVIARRNSSDLDIRLAWREGRLTAEHIHLIPARPHFVAAESPPTSELVGTAPPSRNVGEIGQVGGGADSPSAAAFREASGAMLDQFNQHGAASPPVGEVPTAHLRDRLLSTLDPRAAIDASYRSRFRFGIGLISEADDPLQQVMPAPEFPQPMYESLQKLSQEWLLPGLDKVPPNTVSLLVTNQRFVESFMVGLNHETARLLLRHGYPNDQRGTYFSQFWDPAGYVPPQDEFDKDIWPIHTWRRSDLGRNSSRTIPPSGEHLVLLMRGELLRRYPNAVIYAVKAKLGDEVDGVRKRILGDEEWHPVFSGTLKPDVSFFAFELSVPDARGDIDPDAEQGCFFVLQEQPSEPRFGLDVSTDNPGGFPNSWSDLSWDHMAANAVDLTAITYIDLDTGFPDDSGLDPPWGRTAAEMAYITLQRPARLAIHGSDMLLAL